MLKSSLEQELKTMKKRMSAASAEKAGTEKTMSDASEELATTEKTLDADTKSVDFLACSLTSYAKIHSEFLSVQLSTMFRRFCW